MRVRRVLAVLLGLVLLAVSVPLWMATLAIGTAMLSGMVAALQDGAALAEWAMFLLFAVILFGTPLLITAALTWLGLGLVLGSALRDGLWRRLRRRRQPDPQDAAP